MTTRDDIYHKFGITAEAAQLLELELGTLLMSCHGLRNSLWEKGKSPEANKIYKKIDRSTLGRIISEVKKNTSIDESIEATFAEALKIRNELIHSFYWKHNFKIESDEGRDVMMEDLENMHNILFTAYQLAQGMADIMVQIVVESLPEKV
jgi:uncharacterized protein YutE (UPF0331/DUF86 family)